MSQVGSRKRPAPGARPGAEQSYQHPIHDDQFNRPRLPGNEYLMPWDSENTNHSSPYYADVAASLQAETYGQMAAQSPAENASQQQLARRSANQQILPRAQFSPGPSEAWPNAMQGPGMTGLEDFHVDENELAQRALQAKRERKSIPPFVQKLSSFLDSSSNNSDKTDLIRWSDNGDSFVVLDEDEFAKTLIPELFKHNNYASFVRQLNMYGFHKKVGLSDNSMRASERKNKSPSEYYNPFFKRGQPNLLWLIQKPKAGGKSKGRGKGEENAFDEDGDEVMDGDAPISGAANPDDAASGRVPRQPLMIGGMPPEELSNVHRELQQVRQQQAIITAAFQRIRREHEQLYIQATAFQDLHTRHENSINAILTFLATVYNRSLEGHGSQNGSSLSNLFAEAIPDMQQSGAVVDVASFGNAAAGGANGQSRRPSRKQPLLLQAPPPHSTAGHDHGQTTPLSTAGGGNLLSQSGYGISAMNSMQSAPSPNVREIKEQDSTAHATPSPGYSGFDANTPRSGFDANTPRSEPDIMSFINSANANATANGRNSPGIGGMNFPQALSHLQTADGKAPLSPSQRSSVLQLLSGPAGVSGNDNALTNPSQPNVPTIPDWTASKSELDQLERKLKEQNDKVALLTGMVQPLSPSGSIPGLNDGLVPPLDGDTLDFDRIFNTDYFSDAADLHFGDSLDFGDSATAAYDFGSSSAATAAMLPNGLDNSPSETLGARVVETAESSEATSPANTIDDGGQDEARSPRKRRRRN